MKILKNSINLVHWNSKHYGINSRCTHYSSNTFFPHVLKTKAEPLDLGDLNVTKQTPSNIQKHKGHMEVKGGGGGTCYKIRNFFLTKHMKLKIFCKVQK